MMQRSFITIFVIFFAFGTWTSVAQSNNLELVSSNVTGTGSTNSPINVYVLSEDGSTVALSSRATNLTNDVHTSTFRDIFLRDIASGTSTLITNNTTGTATANGSSTLSLDPRVISQDGNRLVFTSLATDLTTDTDTNGLDDLFIYDANSNTVTLISRTLSNVAGNNNSYDAQISADGSKVVFTSRATDLTAHTDSGGTDIFLYDVASDTISLLSVDTTGTTSGNHDSYAPQISADGNTVVFLSKAINLSTDRDSNGQADLFLYDVPSDTLSLISKNVGGTDTPIWGIASFILSRNGNAIALESRSMNLTSHANPGITLTYLLDIASGTTSLVSTNSAGTGISNAPSSPTSLSPSGNRVVFTSLASDITTDTDTNAQGDLFLYDATTGNNTLISMSIAGSSTGNNSSDDGIISSAGNRVVFRSRATNLTSATDTNAIDDIFLYDVFTGVISLLSFNSAGTAAGNSQSMQPLISGDGGIATFSSIATDLHTNDTSTWRDIFLTPIGTPSISISGNSTLIANGDTTPALSDATDFGDVLVNTTLTQTFTISNTGTADLNVTDITLNSTAPEFVLVTNPAPITLAPSATTSFSISFEPTNIASFTESIEVTSDAPLDTVYTFDIQASGIVDAPDNPPEDNSCTEGSIDSLIALIPNQGIQNSLTQHLIREDWRTLIRETYVLTNIQIDPAIAAQIIEIASCNLENINVDIYNDSSFIQVNMPEYIASTIDGYYSVFIGQTLTLPITISNSTDRTMRDVEVNFSWSNDFDYRSIHFDNFDGNYRVRGKHVIIDGFSLEPGASISLTLTIQLSLSARSGEIVTFMSSFESPDASIHYSPLTFSVMPGQVNTGETPYWRNGLLLTIFFAFSGGLIIPFMQKRKFDNKKWTLALSVHHFVLT